MSSRRWTAFALGLVLAAFGACSPGDAGAGDAMSSPEAAATDASSQQAAGTPPTADELTLAEVLPLSCARVWAAYGESESLVVEIVKAMAGTSVETRGLAFPQTTEAGAALGTRILEGCAADRDELLYSIVDRGVREVVTAMGAEADG